jgi:hypothetical protein
MRGVSNRWVLKQVVDNSVLHQQHRLVSLQHDARFRNRSAETRRKALIGPCGEIVNRAAKQIAHKLIDWRDSRCVSHSRSHLCRALNHGVQVALV